LPVIEIDPRGTSQRCSRCMTVVKKDLSVRVHQCPVCGLELDRDLNAAINILAVGLHSLGIPPRSPSL
jgi:putative transposase